MSHRQRTQGFLETTHERFPGIRIASNVTCNDNHFEDYDRVREQLRKDPTIDMVYIVGEGITGACASICQQPHRQGNSVVQQCFNNFVGEPKQQRAILGNR